MMKFSDYKDYGDYLSSQKKEIIAEITVGEHVFKYPKEATIFFKEGTDTPDHVVVTARDGTVTTCPYANNFNIKSEFEDLPVVSPWYFMEHGGKGW